MLMINVRIQDPQAARQHACVLQLSMLGYFSDPYAASSSVILTPTALWLRSNPDLRSWHVQSRPMLS